MQLQVRVLATSQIAPKPCWTPKACFSH